MKKFYIGKYDRVFKTIFCNEEDQKMIHNTEMHIAYDEGKTEKRIEIAKNMLLKNIDIRTISECTNLSLEEINSLK